MNGDLFPELQNPFRVSLIDGLPDFIANASLPEFNNIANQIPGFTGQNNISTAQAASAFQTSYPNDELSNLYLQSKTKRV